MAPPPKVPMNFFERDSFRLFRGQYTFIAGTDCRASLQRAGVPERSTRQPVIVQFPSTPADDQI
jgi:hypothetical protein